MKSSNSFIAKAYHLSRFAKFYYLKIENKKILDKYNNMMCLFILMWQQVINQWITFVLS